MPSARTIGYSTGPSGVALLELFEHWGIAEVIRPRVVQVSPGVPVGTPLLDEHLLNNSSLDTCVYHQPGIDLLTKVIPAKNILFASEMISAVYIDATANLTVEERSLEYEGNARRVFPRLDAALKAQGR